MPASDLCWSGSRIWYVDTVEFQVHDSAHDDASLARDHAGSLFKPNLQHARFCTVYFPPPNHCFVDNKAVRVMVAVAQG
jgi:hypothetical protein